MNKKPYLLRLFFALLIIGVLAASMFPLTEKDFYGTFLKVVKDAKDPDIVELVDRARQKQAADKFKYESPSVAIEEAAREMRVKGVDGGLYAMDIVKYVKPVIVRSQKLQNNGDVISLVRKNASGSIRLGIDLDGGAEFLLLLKPDAKVSSGRYDEFRDTAIETIRNRLAAQNFFETEITPAGNDFVSVRVPLVNKRDKANLERLILRSAKLEFRLVADNNETEVRKLRDYLAKGGSADDYPDTPPDCEFLSTEDRDKAGNLVVDWVLVEKEVQMLGDEISDAGVQIGQFGGREISLSFTPKGAIQFEDVTTRYTNHRLAIVLDGKLYSAPNLTEPIRGGHARISGSFSQEEARSVADALKSGSLPFEISIESRSDIEPSVGTETVRKSLYSGIIGTVLVMIFMLVIYGVAGLVADLSLLVNALIMVGALAAFDVTLTLPGIAGIVLTIGMAVDANVLIYERIREELKNGKPLRSAVDSGFDRAFSAIFDSNLTTLFCALILFWQGTGTIKGFAITLSIGIFTTMFTAVFLTRLLFDMLLRFFPLKRLAMLPLSQNPGINFFRIKWLTIGLSCLLFTGSLVYIGVQRGKVLGIDFTGGTQLLVAYTSESGKAEPIQPSEVRAFLDKYGYEAKVTYKNVTDEENQEGSRLLEIVVRNRDQAVGPDLTGDELIRNLDEAYPAIKFTKQSESRLGALIGASFTRSAIIALLLSMLGMILYMVIRFQFSYSIAANVALVHDVVVATGIYLVFGGQLTLTVVAALLTLIGYSLNDTIVTFDRQRENLTLMRGKTYLEIVNTSINQTFARTILTSTSVVLILVSQLLFGGEGIHDFIAVMLIGCIVGCYSSIFISPIITAYWHKNAGPNVKESSGPEKPLSGESNEGAEITRA